MGQWRSPDWIPSTLEFFVFKNFLLAVLMTWLLTVAKINSDSHQLPHVQFFFFFILRSGVTDVNGVKLSNCINVVCSSNKGSQNVTLGLCSIAGSALMMIHRLLIERVRYSCWLVGIYLFCFSCFNPSNLFLFNLWHIFVRYLRLIVVFSSAGFGCQGARVESHTTRLLSNIMDPVEMRTNNFS